MHHLKKIILALAFILAILIVKASFFRQMPDPPQDQPVGSINDQFKTTTPYLINIFEKEKEIRPPFDFNQIEQPHFPEKICAIDQYGGIGDGMSLNTSAFARAINDCAEQGGGVVEVPAGKWLTGAIKLESNINLHLDKDATIIFSENPNNYLPTAFSRYEGVEYIGYSPFIYASHSQNIAITGSGKLDGQGQLWWPKNNMTATLALYDMATKGVPVEKRVFDKANMMIRPSFIQFEKCNSILLEDFTVTNSPMWTIHPLYSSNILMRNLNVNTPGLNTDGIAIDSSRNILIEDSTVASGDDAITIKAGRDSDGLRVNMPSENIIIRDCNIIDGHAGLSLGSETSGSIRNVFVYNYKIKYAKFAIRLKSSIGRGGTIENIWVSDVDSDRNTSDCIQMNTDYDPQRTPGENAVPTFNNINFENIACKKSSGSINILGIKDKPIENVSLENISINSRKAVSISNVKNVDISGTSIVNRDNEPTYQLSNTQDVKISGLECLQMKKKECIEIQR